MYKSVRISADAYNYIVKQAKEQNRSIVTIIKLMVEREKELNNEN